jgi:CheY-like chemotaxis protein
VLLLFNRFDAAEEQLLQRQRLETLGRMVAGVTHDLNNLLSAIVAGVDFLEAASDDLSLGHPDARECIADLRLAATKANELTGSMLAFARGERGSTGLVDITRVCTETVRLVRHTLGPNIRIQTEIAPNLLVRGSYSEMHQALMNLCLNARDAMPSGGLLRIDARLQEASKVLLKESRTHRAQRYVVIRLQDTGSGMDEATMSRAFEPFFSTKGEGKGFGLGLATVKEIISLHGGEIDVESAAGQGTAFVLHLPAAQAGAATEAAGSAVSSRAPATLDMNKEITILVVDDEPVVRRSVARILAQAGYRVIQAPDGMTALAAATATQAPDLVLLDQDMPQMTGEQTQERLLEIAPQIPVLFGSGRVDPATEARVLAKGAIGFLKKPYTRDMLVEAIGSSLERTDNSDTQTQPKVTDIFGDKT